MDKAPSKPKANAGLKSHLSDRIHAQAKICERKLNGDPVNVRLTRSYKLFQPIKNSEHDTPMPELDDDGADSDATIILPVPNVTHGVEKTITCSVKTTTYGLRKRSRKERKEKKKEKFLKLSLLNAHYRDRHPPLICKVCDKEFVTPSALE